MTSIATGVDSQLANVSGKLDAELQRKVELDTQYKALIEKQRTYFALAKQFQLACEENEELERQIEQLTAEAQRAAAQ